MQRYAIAAALALGLAGCQNFHPVEEGRFYRSAQPREGAVERWVGEHGIKTILRLNGGGPGRPDYDIVQQPADAAGIKLKHLPMSAMRYPTREELLELWEFFASADYPVLVQCRGGADRTGLASALYVLQRTGDIERARDQLDFFPYLHTGHFGTDKLDKVFDEYEPWHGRISFPHWVRRLYGIGRVGRE